MKYLNISKVAKSFHGVTFEPGEVKSVPGFANDPWMIKVTPELEEEIKKATKNSDDVKKTVKSTASAVKSSDSSEQSKTK